MFPNDLLIMKGWCQVLLHLDAKLETHFQLSTNDGRQRYCEAKGARNVSLVLDLVRVAKVLLQKI